MTRIRYRPAASGGWLAFAWDTRLLLLPTMDATGVDAAWKAVAEDNGFQGALDLLTRNGLSETPSFVLLEEDDRSATRIIVRGDVVVELVDGSGSQRLSGSEVSTWTERRVVGLTRLSVSPGGVVDVGDSPSLPLSSGAVIFGELTLDRDSAATAESAEPAAFPREAEPAAQHPRSAAPEETITDLADGPATPGSGYEALFGDTVHRPTGEAAAFAAEGSATEPEADASDVAGDHDGHTVLTSDIAKLRSGRARQPAPEPESNPNPSTSPPPSCSNSPPVRGNRCRSRCSSAGHPA